MQYIYRMKRNIQILLRLLLLLLHLFNGPFFHDNLGKLAPER